MIDEWGYIMEVLSHIHDGIRWRWGSLDFYFWVGSMVSSMQYVL